MTFSTLGPEDPVRPGADCVAEARAQVEDEARRTKPVDLMAALEASLEKVRQEQERRAAS